MTAKDAADIIGCSPRQVRALICSGRIKAKRVKCPQGYYYTITRREAERYRDTPQKMGWPRGQSYELVDV